MTYLQVVNNILKRLRERTVASVDETTYSKLIGVLVNDALIEEVKPFYKCVTSHTARRTFITLASEANVPDHIIMGICGIRDSKTLKTYKKFNPDVLENYVDTIF